MNTYKIIHFVGPQRLIETVSGYTHLEAVKKSQIKWEDILDVVLVKK